MTRAVTGANRWAAVEVELSYAGRSEALGSVRADVSRWCRDQGFSPELVDQAVLVTSELASNAVEAAPDEPFTVTLRRRAGRAAAIRVVNRAVRSTPPPRHAWHPPDPLAPRGRGLAIVAAVSREVAVEYPSAGEVAIVACLADDHVGGRSGPTREDSSL